MPSPVVRKSKSGVILVLAIFALGAGVLASFFYARHALKPSPASTTSSTLP